MTQRDLLSELLEIREQIDEKTQAINQVSHTLFVRNKKLQDITDAYNKKWEELIKQELHSRGMTWCTMCFMVVPMSRVKLLFTEGREMYSGGGEYGFRGFSELHRACTTCWERAFDEHGQKGEYDSTLRDQTIFYAFRVEKRSDGYYARKFGHWIKLVKVTESYDARKSGNWVKLTENCKLDDDVPYELRGRLARGWKLPERIEFNMIR